MRYYCTYFDINYLAKGLALIESMQAHCQPYHLWILALCKETEAALKALSLPNVSIVSMPDFETPDLLAAKGNRSPTEYIWTCTGSWILHVMSIEPEINHLSYIDADLLFFSDPEPVFEEVGKAPIGITPHRFSPRMRAWLKIGEFNVGLIYVWRCLPGLACIQEWTDQCIEWCYWRHENDQYCDQKYLNEWPTRWGAHSIQHKGANLAPWNQETQYTYSLRGGQIYVDDDELIWYHFHKGLESGYIVEPFIQEHVYGAYRRALERVT